MAPRRSDLGLPLLAVDHDHGYRRCLLFRYEWLMLRMQKNGSNKWVCVCATGASRCSACTPAATAPPTSAALSRTSALDWDSPAAGDQQDEPLREKKLMDCSEYLDDTGECNGGRGVADSRDDAVITAVTELGHGKPQCYSTPDVVSFCRKWRLPTNHVSLFSMSGMLFSCQGRWQA